MDYSESPNDITSFRKTKRKYQSQEEFAKLSKEELLERVLRFEHHNEQLKNIISKLQGSREKQDGSPANKRRKFDFTKCSMRHVVLKLLYLGWDYNGFTVQEDTTNTIEHHLFVALTRSCLIDKRETSNYHRCGRTDKGVSAFTQVISLDIRSKLTKEQLERDSSVTEGEMEYPKILNRLLPPNIRVLAWSPVSSDYSARFNCKQRTYRYFFPRGDLNIEDMNSAAQFLIGAHDFRNFCKMDVANGVVNFGREIKNANINTLFKDPTCRDEESAYDICELELVGQAFLWHQVRCIMGILFLVGQGNEKPEVVKELLDIEKHPEKPQYNLASHVPLNLFDCEFESTNWIISSEVIVDVMKTLQNEWTICSVKSSMLRCMLDHCQDVLPSGICVKNQSSCLLQGTTSKVYKPLFDRQTCSSLENRISHYVSKKRLVVLSSGSNYSTLREKKRKTDEREEVVFTYNSSSEGSSEN